ncbi:pectinesterase family protein [Granulicella cerasi]|uniref:Pectinesterase family protein n=1 Tax=Granulicella cerasi TaxID=741063 RepID=A0ABW1ZDC2_9BACT|nr:pectinesterase family protein [Granulicella cerasi]
MLWRHMFSALCLASTAVFAQDVHVHVAQNAKVDATHFPTIQMALDHAADVGPQGKLFLHIAPGVYKERVWVSPRRARTVLLGEGKSASDVVISAGMNAAHSGGTFFTETVEVNADDFAADNITFENTAGPTGQALAIAVSADRAIFKRCRFLGDQDTLFADYGRQYYVDSYIEGGVDFIFGNATAVFDRDEIHILRPGYLTAQSRTNAEQPTGYVIKDSRVTAGDLQGKRFFLGRPWRAYARVVVMRTELPVSLDPRGWSEWKQNAAELAKVSFAEFENKGPGAATQGRASWTRSLSPKEAAGYEPKVFLAGADHWDAPVEAAKLP